MGVEQNHVYILEYEDPILELTHTRKLWINTLKLCIQEWEDNECKCFKYTYKSILSKRIDISLKASNRTSTGLSLYAYVYLSP